MNGEKNNCEKRLSRRNLLKESLLLGLVLGISPGSLFVTGCSRRKNTRPNILLITLDTTRTDHLGCYGYHKDTTPNLDALANESVVYTRAVSTSSWTLPSHASLLTGKFPTSHGAHFDPKGPLSLTDAIEGSASWKQYRARGLAANEVTLSSVLRHAGYSTGAVVAGPWLKKVFGFQQGFDFYDDNRIGTINGRLADDVTSTAIQWIEKVKNRSFFLFLNYFDPHWPYEPPETFAKKFLPLHMVKVGKNISKEQLPREQLAGLYDAEILYMDYYIGRLLKKLKSLDLYDNTWIIITADHGDLHGEHGKFGHGKYLYQEEIHIPLFMKFPSGEEAHKQIDSRVQLIDILPTVCNRVGISFPRGIQGSLLPYVKHPIIAETYPPPFHSKTGSWRAIFEENYKFIWNSHSEHMLFNLQNDPEENINLADSKQRQIGQMTNSLNRYLAGLPKPGPLSTGNTVDKSTKEALKSLGYVQ